MGRGRRTARVASASARGVLGLPARALPAQSAEPAPQQTERSRRAELRAVLASREQTIREAKHTLKRTTALANNLASATEQLGNVSCYTTGGYGGMYGGYSARRAHLNQQPSTIRPALHQALAHIVDEPRAAEMIAVVSRIADDLPEDGDYYMTRESGDAIAAQCQQLAQELWPLSDAASQWPDTDRRRLADAQAGIENLRRTTAWHNRSRVKLDAANKALYTLHRELVALAADQYPRSLDRFWSWARASDSLKALHDTPAKARTPALERLLAVGPQVTSDWMWPEYAPAGSAERTAECAAAVRQFINDVAAPGRAASMDAADEMEEFLFLPRTAQLGQSAPRESAPGQTSTPGPHRMDELVFGGRPARAQSAEAGVAADTSVLDRDLFGPRPSPPSA